MSTRWPVRRQPPRGRALATAPSPGHGACVRSGMRYAPLALLFLARPARSADVNATEVLAALCDVATPEFERDLGECLVRRLPGSLALIDALRARVQSETGIAIVARVLVRSKAALCEHLAAGEAAEELRGLLPRLSEPMQQGLMPSDLSVSCSIRFWLK